MRTEDFKFDCIRATIRFEHPTWSDTQVFEQSIVQAKLGTFGRPTTEAGAVLVAVALDKSQKPAPVKVKGSLVTGAFSLPLFPEDEGYE